MHIVYAYIHFMGKLSVCDQDASLDTLVCSAPVEFTEVVTTDFPGRRAGPASAAFHNASTVWLCVNPAAYLHGYIHIQMMLQCLHVHV